MNTHEKPRTWTKAFGDAHTWARTALDGGVPAASVADIAAGRAFIDGEEVSVDWFRGVLAAIAEDASAGDKR